MTCNRGSKVAVLHPPHWTRVWPLQIQFFCPTSSTYQKHFNLGQCLEIDDRRPLSIFGDVTLPCSHFTDRYIFYRHFIICILQTLHFVKLPHLLPLTLAIDNFGRLPYLKVIFLEINKLNIFWLCRPIICRPDELFPKLLRISYLFTRLDIW